MPGTLPFAAVAAIMLIAAPVAAQDEWRPVSPESSWMITDSTCQIDGGWEGDIQVSINRHLDHHDLTIYDNAITRLVPGRLVTLRVGTSEDPAQAQDYQALGYNVDGELFYVFEADEALLDRMAADGNLRVWRGKALIENLDMTGFAEALDAARACEAVTPMPEEQIPADTESVADANATAEAAMDAAIAAARQAN